MEKEKICNCYMWKENRKIAENGVTEYLFLSTDIRVLCVMAQFM